MWWKKLLKTVLAAVAGMLATGSDSGMEAMAVSPELAGQLEIILGALVAILLAWIRSPNDDPA